MTTGEQEPVLACNLGAIPDEQRALHGANVERLFSAVLEVRELPTGRAFRLPNDAEMLSTVAAFIANERLCCPFFHFKLEVEPQQGPMWLHLTGKTDVKSLFPGEEKA